MAVAGEESEQSRGRHDGQGADQPRPERRPERREQHAVAGQVVTAVPVVVPEQEAMRGEQVRAEGLGREVGARRPQDQVGDREEAGGTASLPDKQPTGPSPALAPRDR